MDREADSGHDRSRGGIAASRFFLGLSVNLCAAFGEFQGKHLLGFAGFSRDTRSDTCDTTDERVDVGEGKGLRGSMSSLPRFVACHYLPVLARLLTESTVAATPEFSFSTFLQLLLCFPGLRPPTLATALQQHVQQDTTVACKRTRAARRPHAPPTTSLQTTTAPTKSNTLTLCRRAPTRALHVGNERLVVRGPLQAASAPEPAQAVEKTGALPS